MVVVQLVRVRVRVRVRFRVRVMVRVRVRVRVRVTRQPIVPHGPTRTLRVACSALTCG